MEDYHHLIMGLITWRGAGMFLAVMLGKPTARSGEQHFSTSCSGWREVAGNGAAGIFLHICFTRLIDIYTTKAVVSIVRSRQELLVRDSLVTYRGVTHDTLSRCSGGGHRQPGSILEYTTTVVSKAGKLPRTTAVLPLLQRPRPMGYMRALTCQLQFPLAVVGKFSFEEEHHPTCTIRC